MHLIRWKCVSVSYVMIVRKLGDYCQLYSLALGLYQFKKPELKTFGLVVKTPSMPQLSRSSSNSVSFGFFSCHILVFLSIISWVFFHLSIWSSLPISLDGYLVIFRLCYTGCVITCMFNVKLLPLYSWNALRTQTHVALWVKEYYI